MANQQIAQTIIEQLGGRKFQAMTSAKFSAMSNGLAVSFKGSRKANLCYITVDQSDTYTVDFKKLVGAKLTDICKESGVYNKQLTGFFESVTGLLTSL
jgi:type 1 fimbria pilin